MSKRKQEQASPSNITVDGFINIDGLPPIDLLGVPLDFRFKDAGRDEYTVLMVIASGAIPCPECKEVCDDCVIMKTKRKSDDIHCDIFTCKKCGFAMNEAPDTVMLSTKDWEDSE